jgi:hypothetical protein
MKNKFLTTILFIGYLATFVHGQSDVKTCNSCSLQGKVYTDSPPSNFFNQKKYVIFEIINYTNLTYTKYLESLLKGWFEAVGLKVIEANAVPKEAIDNPCVVSYCYIDHKMVFGWKDKLDFKIKDCQGNDLYYRSIKAIASSHEDETYLLAAKIYGNLFKKIKYQCLVPNTVKYVNEPMEKKVDGNCHHCSGKGKNVCSTCMGKTPTCTSCNGTKKIRCSSCSGQGSSLCYSCSGTGGRNVQETSYESSYNYTKKTTEYKTVYKMVYKPCSSCSGRGRSTCTICWGAGFSNCNNYGCIHGKISCGALNCSGGFTTCEYCKGSGSEK